MLLLNSLNVKDISNIRTGATQVTEYYNTWFIFARVNFKISIFNIHFN